MRRKKIAARILAAVLTASMSISMVPSLVLAEDFSDGAEFSAGEGVELTVIPEGGAAQEEETEIGDDFLEEAVDPFSDGGMAEDDISEIFEEEDFSAGEDSYSASVDYITVEKYDAEGNGEFLVAPAAIEYDDYKWGGEKLELAQIAYQGSYSSVTGIADASQDDGYLDNGDMENGQWIAVQNGTKKTFGYLGYGMSSGSVYRFIYCTTSDGSDVGIGSSSSQKNSLISYIMGLTDEQKNGSAKAAYEAAMAVIVNGKATAEDVSAAQAALDEALNPKIPAESITLDKDKLILGVNDKLSVQATVLPENTTDTLTWSIADTSIATVDSNGNLKASIYPGETTLTVKANDSVYVSIPVTVTAKSYVTISVEVYENSRSDYNRNGRYLVEPTQISMTSNRYIKDILADAVGGLGNLKLDYDNYDQVIGIRDDTQEDGFVDDKDFYTSNKWGYLVDGDVRANGGGNSYNDNVVAPGQVIRVIYAYRGSSYFSDDNVPKYAANKDELIALMAGMNARQKQTAEYAAAKEVALYGDATNDVAGAIASLKGLPENPVVLSAKNVEIRMGESVTVTADSSVEWSINPDSSDVAAVTGKTDLMNSESYCAITGKKPGTTTVYATNSEGYRAECKVTVIPPVYFQADDGTVIEMNQDGSFDLSSLNVGRFVINKSKEDETAAIFECEDKIPVWNPVDKTWNTSFHWWVDDETGTWQPAAAKLTKPVTVSTNYFKTQFTINYTQISGITDMKAYIGENEVSMENPFEITGTMWTENNNYYGETVTVKAKDSEGNEITIPSQALAYETDDPNYNFRFVGNKLIINRAGTHTATISLKQQSGMSEGAPSVSFKAICNEVPVTDMHVDVDDANNNICYIDEWQDNGQHYVGIRPGSWDGETGEKLNNGYHITFEPYNTTQRDVKWEVVEGEDVATHSELHEDGIIPYKAGTVKFKVTNIYNEDIYQYVTVTFKYKNPLKAALTDDSFTMTKDTSMYLNIDFNPTNATEQRFDWTYDKNGIVEVIDKIESSEDGMTSWTVHKIKATGTGIVKVTGTPWDQTGGCSPITFIVAVGASKADAKAALSVYNKITAIREVTLDSKASIEAARTAYNKLTDAQKALLKNEEEILKAAEKKLDELEKTRHVHAFGKWNTVKEATVFATGLKERTCKCGEKETQVIAKLEPKMTVNATTLPLKVTQSTKVLKVTGLAKGDYVKSWKSSSEKIFKVTGKKDGTCTIKAQSKTGKATLTITLASGLKKKVTVSVQSGKVKTTKITGLKSKLTVAKGKKATLKPVLYPITSQEKITYASSDKKVASVTSSGVIKALAPGKAVITVTSGTKKVKVTVTVPGITNVKSSVSIKKGKTLTLKPQTFGISEKVTYTSSNTKVATVNSNGKIKGIKKGTAIITVKAGNYSVKCKVTVK